MRLLTNSENHFSKPIQRPYSGKFDPENAFRKQPVILKMVPDAGYGTVCTVLWRKLTNSKEATTKFNQ
jgi:hypothetical protein